MTCSSWAQPTLIPSLPFQGPGPRPQVEYEPDVMLVYKPSPPHKISCFPAKRPHGGPGLSPRDRRRHLHCRSCPAAELAPLTGLIPSRVPWTFRTFWTVKEYLQYLVTYLGT